MLIGMCEHVAYRAIQGRRSYVFFWVRTHPLLRRIVYYCVCIQHDIDKSQISSIELCFSKHCVVTAEFKISISPADCGVWTHPPGLLTACDL